MREDWKLETLGSVAEFRGGGTPSTDIAQYWDGGIPWISPKDMKSDEVGASIDTITAEAIENSAASLISKGSILIVVRSGILARTVPVAITTREVAVNQDIKALCPIRTVDNRYLHYFVRGAERKILQLVTRGATVHRISTDALRALPIPIPPLPEQKRIVAILDEAFEGIDTAVANTEKNLANARELLNANIVRAICGDGRGWAKKRLGDVVIRLTNGYVGPTRNIYHDTGVPYLLARHVKNNLLTFDGKTFISKEFNQRNKKSILKTGDVLLVQSGHIGHSAVVSEEHDGHNCHAMIVISPRKEIITGKFLSLLFNSTPMRRRFEKIRSGSTVPHLTCREVKELSVELPNLADQQCIVDQIQELQTETERLETIYCSKLQNLQQLKQAILERAFAGDLASRSETAIPEAAE